MDSRGPSEQSLQQRMACSSVGGSLVVAVQLFLTLLTSHVEGMKALARRAEVEAELYL